jgi:threonine/homoserine/homoserine lactone efflux protein
MSSIVAMSMFSLLMSATPGPVNVLTLNSGLINGFKKTLPFVLGATLGFTLLLIVLGLGLAKILLHYPQLVHNLSYLATAYLVYLAYQLFTASAHINLSDETANSFTCGFSLQWMNPKAWIACLTGLSAFCTHEPYLELLIFSLIYCVICLLSIGAWALVGNAIKGIIKKPTALSYINKLISMLLLACAFLLHF